MSWLGRAIGNFGSQAGEGYFAAQDLKQKQAQLGIEQARQKLTELMAPLQLEELKARLAQMNQQQQLAPWQSYKKQNADGSTEEGLYNVLTGERKQVASGAATAPKYQSFRVDNSGKLWGFNERTGKEEAIEGSEGANFVPPSSTGLEHPETQVFGGYRWQYDPSGKVQGTRQGPWVRLGIAKEPGTGAEGAGNLDALIYDIAAGKANMPAGKLGAQVATRAKQMGVELPNRNVGEVNKAAAEAKNLADAYAQAKAITDASSRGGSDRLAALADKVFGGTNYRADLNSRRASYFRPGHFSDEEAKNLVLAIQDAYETKRKEAADAYSEAYPGQPLPPWLRDSSGGSATDVSKQAQSLGAKPK